MFLLFFNGFVLVSMISGHCLCVVISFMVSFVFLVLLILTYVLNKKQYIVPFVFCGWLILTYILEIPKIRIGFRLCFGVCSY